MSFNVSLNYELFQVVENKMQQCSGDNIFPGADCSQKIFQKLVYKLVNISSQILSGSIVVLVCEVKISRAWIRHTCNTEQFC